MAKTQPTDATPESVIESVEHPVRRADARVLLDIYRKVTGQPGVVWGTNIVGFGTYEQTQASGKQVTWMRSAFSPRKQYLSIYLMAGGKYQAPLLEKLGKYKMGASCLNVTKLADVDMDVLEALIAEDLKAMNTRYPGESGEVG